MGPQPRGKEKPMKVTGKQFMVRGSTGIEKTMSVTGENGGSLMVRMVTKSPYGVMESDEVLTRELFDSCLRTGFIREIPATNTCHGLTVA
jgi:hypothetical protein